MKKFKLIIVFFATVFTLQTFARKKLVLPPPVFGNQPTYVQVVLKNVSEERSFIISSCIREIPGVNRDIQSKTTVVDKKRKNTQKCDFSLKSGMSMYATLIVGEPSPITDSISQQQTLKEYRIFIITVPGKRVECTIDMQNGEMSFKSNDGFAKFYEEANKLTSTGEKYLPSRILLPGVPDEVIDDVDELVEYYHDMPPAVIADSLQKRYHEAEHMMTEKWKLSDSVKELWMCNLEVEMLKYLNYYLMAYQQLHSNNQEDSLSVNTPQLHGICPFAGNAIFYSTHVNDLPYILKITKLFSDQDQSCDISPNLIRLIRAQKIAEDMDYLTPQSQKQFETLKSELPEYYESLKKIMEGRQSRLDNFHSTPMKGHFCKLDKTLEGDSILTALINRYKGKPTIICISPFVFFLQWDIKATLWEIYKDLSDYRELFNYVTLYGGGHTEEMEWKEWMRDYDGDHYYLMKYQAEWLFKQYSIDEQIIDGLISNRCCLGIAADGTVHIFNDDKPGHPLEAVNWLLSQLGVK